MRCIRVVRIKIVVLAFFALSSGGLYAMGFDERVEISSGDVDGDGDTDLYVHQPASAVMLHGVGVVATPSIDDLILEQNSDGSFDASEAKGARLETALSWARVFLTTVIGDVNADYSDDLIIRNFDNLTSVSAPPQIVFSPSPSSNATDVDAVTAIDDDMKDFFRDAEGWLIDEEYYFQEANFIGNVCIAGDIVEIWEWIFTPGIGGEPGAGAWEYLLVGVDFVCTESVALYDGSIFHPRSYELVDVLIDVGRAVDDSEVAEGIVPGSPEAILIAEILSDVLDLQTADGVDDTVYNDGGLVTANADDTLTDQERLQVPVFTVLGNTDVVLEPQEPPLSEREILCITRAWGLGLVGDLIYWDVHYGRNNSQADAVTLFPNVEALESSANFDRFFKGPDDSVAHNIRARGNVEYRSRDRRSYDFFSLTWVDNPFFGYQLVYDSDDALVTHPRNYGTFDFSPPTSLIGIRRHISWDVVPWLEWGNQPFPIDDSTRQERLEALREGVWGWVFRRYFECLPEDSFPGV